MLWQQVVYRIINKLTNLEITDAHKYTNNKYEKYCKIKMKSLNKMQIKIVNEIQIAVTLRGHEVVCDRSHSQNESLRQLVAQLKWNRYSVYIVYS